MKRIHLVAVVAITLIVLVFAYSQSPLQSPQTRPTAIQTVESQRQTAAAAERFTIEREVGTQQRINRYFHADIVPKLKNCWSSVQGKGTIALKYTYTKAGGRWTFSRLETDQSTLPSGQNTVAQKCMSDAVRGTSFPVDGSESSGNTFVLNWKWPVPFPAAAAQLTTAMFAARVSNSGGSGDDCDGNGTPAKCYTCDLSYNCKKVCVGLKDCKVTSPGPDCTASGYCASGGPFGVSGSRVIY